MSSHTLSFYLYLWWAVAHTTHVGSATSQWFASLDNIKDDAIAALQDVNFVPAICMFILMDPYN